MTDLVTRTPNGNIVAPDVWAQTHRDGLGLFDPVRVWWARFKARWFQGARPQQDGLVIERIQTAQMALDIARQLQSNAVTINHAVLTEAARLLGVGLAARAPRAGGTS